MGGDAETISGKARGGNDRLDGGNDDDVVYGDAKSLSDSARAGNDKLWGGAGNDTIYGDAETLSGKVRAGNDKLDGGAGDDQLWGGRGNDVFVFGEGSGADTINDFGRVLGDRDLIDLS